MKMKVKISYMKLIMILHERKIKLSNLCKECGLSTNVATSINNDKSITLDSIARIALYLNVGLDEIIHIEKDKNTYNMNI